MAQFPTELWLATGFFRKTILDGCSPSPKSSPQGEDFKRRSFLVFAMDAAAIQRLVFSKTRGTFLPLLGGVATAAMAGEDGC